MENEGAIQRLDKQILREARVQREGIIRLLAESEAGRAFLGHLLEQLQYGKPLFHENPYILAGIAATASVGQGLVDELNRVSYAILPQILKDRDDARDRNNARRRNAAQRDQLYGDDHNLDADAGEGEA